MMEWLLGWLVGGGEGGRGERGFLPPDRIVTRLWWRAGSPGRWASRDARGGALVGI